MNLRDRLIKLLQGGRILSPELRKESPFLWPHLAGDGAISWGMGNFQDYVNEGFNLNSLIYSAIMYKVRSAAQVKMRAYTGDPLNPKPLPPNHQLSRLVARPNPWQSWRELHGLILVYLNLSGNAYLMIDRTSMKRGIPSALYPLRPDRVYLIPSADGMQGYLYRPEGQSGSGGIPILAEDMIHFKFPNPMDPFEGLGYGLSPISPLAQSGDIDNQITKFLKLFFEHGGTPMGLLKFNIPLPSEQVTIIKDRWREIYGGVDNWGDIGILDSGAEYQKLGMTFNEMGFAEIDERNESRILGPFGVPPILIGTKFGLERSTDTNYQNARKSFWEDTMMYELTLQQDEYDYYLAGEDGSFCRYDTSQVAALQVNVGELVTSAKALFDMGVPSDKAFQTVGLTVEETPAGKVSFIPTTHIPYEQMVAQGEAAVSATQAAAQGGNDVELAPDDEEDDEEQNNEGAAGAETEIRSLPSSPRRSIEVAPGVRVRRKRLRLVNHLEEVAASQEIPFE